MNCILLDSDWKFVATMHCSGSALSCIIWHSVALELMACSSPLFYRDEHHCMTLNLWLPCLCFRSQATQSTQR
jgi:hypothetical protein